MASIFWSILPCGLRSRLCGFIFESQQFCIIFATRSFILPLYIVQSFFIILLFFIENVVFGTLGNTILYHYRFNCPLYVNESLILFWSMTVVSQILLWCFHEYSYCNHVCFIPFYVQSHLFSDITVLCTFFFQLFISIKSFFFFHACYRLLHRKKVKKNNTNETPTTKPLYEK